MTLVLFTAFQLNAQTSSQQADNPNAPVITFDKVVHDYGTIVQNSDGGCEFKFTNDGKEPLILLSHNPLAFDTIRENQQVLMLAGDTHGGQIPLPSYLWKILGYEKCARYNQGLFENSEKKMFVSRGIGTSHLPMRILRRPEVAVLHFTLN